MRRLIKLLAAVAVATTSAPAAELPLALCEDIEVIDTKVLAKPPKRGDEPLPDLLMDFLDTYAKEHPDTYAGTWLSGAISRKWRQGRERGDHRLDDRLLRGLRGAALRAAGAEIRVRPRRAV